ncbi:MULTISPECIES: TetR/AcrR family transcriptional regulator [unclassified Ruegeria]|uniref:TetR/AcrR family transcriptional regulator n=1 Tax=unclassified Ruegeria TaxID=2625375 RepID=UPI0014876A76|nr:MULTISPECIES: TetR/AcrR family transcriptional regulator [unclassified Ruegeria]
MGKDTNGQREAGLRERLIDAGIELLHSGGASALTLRKCAARAGVSHAAPAHHFNGVEGLLTAIAARGYQRFASTMLEHLNSAPAAHRDRLYSICEGYQSFSKENEALYELMFNSGQIDFCDLDLADKSRAAFEILEQCCAPLHEIDTSPFTLEITIWSLLHGYCSLTRNAREGGGEHPATKVSFQQLFDRVVRAD